MFDSASVNADWRDDPLGRFWPAWLRASTSAGQAALAALGVHPARRSWIGYDAGRVIVPCYAGDYWNRIEFTDDWPADDFELTGIAEIAPDGATRVLWGAPGMAPWEPGGPGHWPEAEAGEAEEVVPIRRTLLEALRHPSALAVLDWSGVGFRIPATARIDGGDARFGRELAGRFRTIYGAARPRILLPSAA